MAAVQQRILNWLYSVLTSEYHDVNRTYNDVAQALSFYSSLTPRTEVYTYENGASALLLQLSGTLPVTFRGTTYRFPIAVWIPHAYPRDAPLVYVTPTESMAVRAGQHVDPQGKVYHPYLVGWGEQNESNVLDFLARLRDAFAREPPVVARQPQRQSSLSSPRPSSIPPPVPPLPTDMRRAPQSPVSASAQSPPPPPPKPYGQNQEQAWGHRPGQDNRRQSGPPLPPLPPGMGSSSSGPPALHPYQNGQSQFQPQRQGSLRYECAPPISPQQPIPNARMSMSNAHPLQDGYQPQPHMQSSNQTSFQQDHPPQAGFQQHPHYQHPQSYSPQTRQWQNQPNPQPPQPKPAAPSDLMDSPLTFAVPQADASHLPAPPIPHNPEKDMLLHTLAQALYAQRQQALSQTQSSLPGLHAQHAAMLNSLTAMQSEMASLTALSNTLTTNTSILHSSLQAADSTIQNSQNKEPPKIDEILVAPTVVGNQLYDLISEERALGDALFLLGRAVERGRVDGKGFVKATRGLAREWFLKKALVRKIGRGMGLSLESGVAFRR